MVRPRSGKEIVSLDTGCRFTVGGSMTVTRDGRVLMVTTGPETFGNKENFGIGRAEMWESRDCGRSWDGPRLMHRGSPKGLMLPGSLLRLASGKLLLVLTFYGGYDFVTHDPEKSLLEFYTQFSDDDGRTWTAAARIPETWRYANVPLGILQLRSGRVLIPSGYLTPHKGRSVVSALYSDDEGRTWRRSPSVLDTGGEGFESGPCEPTVVELPDGRLWMLMRTQTGVQWEAFSEDGGVTWGAPRPSRFTSSSAPAHLLRLRDGRIVVLWCNCVASPYARHSFSIAASDDGGQSFYGFREVARVGPPVPSLELRWGAAYPFPCEAPDGTLLVAFNNGDWKHMHVKVARLDPDWVRQESLVEDFRDGLGEWCGLGAAGESLPSAEGDAGGVELHMDWVAPGPSGMTRNFPLLSDGVVTCDLTVHKAPAYLLWHNSFLSPGVFEDSCLRVRFDACGAVHVGSGAPTRRAIAQAKWSPAYAYTAYPVTDEIECAQTVQLGRRFTLTARVKTGERTAWVSVDGGREVARPLSDVLGFCYFGIAVGDGGAVRLHRLQTRPCHAREM